MMIQYKETKLIKDEDLRPLYESVGWSYGKKFDDLSVLLTGSYLVYSAWDNDKLVGFIRTVGDGVSIQYVQDLVVLPDYRKFGIGKALMGYVLEKSEHIRQFVLITDAGSETQYVRDWYKKQGLTAFEEASVAGFWRIK